MMDADALAKAADRYFRLNRLVREYKSTIPAKIDLDWRSLLGEARNAEDQYHLLRQKCGLDRLTA